MIELLKTLCSLNGVSGDEGAVRDFIRKEAEPYADSIRTDALGNLIVFKRGSRSTGNKLLIAAHMDEVGLIVRHITEDGFLKFDFVGGVDRRVSIGKRVQIGPNCVPGVIGLKAIHLNGKGSKNRRAVYRYRSERQRRGPLTGFSGRLRQFCLSTWRLWGRIFESKSH